ncbi:MAG: hemagglutinin/hemolysin-related protein, partial [Planctomycetaceae bacterium]|nr:hemagglutinin/hemolysin-related protein [Planctomycetaceae bacterium]
VSLADLDGDGVTDLAVGATGDGTGGTGRGAVHVLLLNSNGTVKSDLKIASSTNGGPALNNGDSFGSSLASLGDVNGDGVVDLAVGAPGTDSFGTNQGAVRLLSFAPIDLVPPTLASFTRNTPAASSTNADTLIFRATFSEPVKNVDSADFSVSGTTASVTVVAAVGGSNGTQYDITVSGGNLATLNGTVGLNLATTPTIADLAGNALPTSEPATDESYLLDNLSPALTIIPNGTSINASSVTFTFQFTEPVSGFDASDISVSNGVKGTFAVVAGDTYTLNVTPVSDGTISVSIGANVAQDAATNGNSGAAAAILIDRTSPALSITPNGTLTNAASILFTFQFTELVTGFTTSDIVIANGTAGAFTAVDGDTYTLLVTPTADGAVTVNVGANAAQDAATNGNTAASASVTSDRSLPGLNITPNGTTSNSNSITFTFQFTEPVTGFTASDSALINASAGLFTAVDADTYTLVVTPTADGLVTVNVGANAAQDAATNGNIATNASVTVDRTLPGLNITPNSSVTNSSSIVFTFQFTEPVTGFAASDVSISNGTAGTFTAVDGDTYTLFVTPAADGQVAVSVGANAAQDAATNGNVATSVAVTSDRTAPTLAVTPNGIVTSANPIVFTFQFSEVVSGFNANDISITNGSAGTFTAIDGDTYTLLVTPASAGTVTVNVGANAAQDVATNGNSAATASVTSDPNAVTLGITPNGIATNAATILFTFQFNKPVTGFTAGDVTLTNGTAGTFTAVDGDTYTLLVTPIADGPVTASVAANAAQDSLSNGNVGASASVIADHIRPGLSITPNSTSTNASPIAFTFQFTEPVTGFAVADVSLTNGAAGIFTAVDADTYTLLVTPSADGVVSVSVGANVAQDAAANGNNAATASVISDRTAPVLSITPNSGSTNAGAITFTFQFSETVTGFDANDVTLSNGTAGAFTAVDGDTYTLLVTPISDGAIIASVGANAAQDAVLNGNSAASASINSDRTAPGLSITPNATATNASPITFTFQFTEAVTGFAVGDVSITNGTAGTFIAIDGDTYTLQVTPAANGLVTVNVAANAAQDLAANGNTAASASVTSDRTAPSLNITPNGIFTNAAATTFTFQFSEAVNGFDLSDIVLTNGSAGTFTAVDADTYTLLVIPTSDGVVSVAVAANAAQDAATNGNIAASASVTSDRTAPVLTITPNATTTNANPISFTFQFSEAVTGFTSGDITVTNGTAGTFTAVDADTYTLLVTPTTVGQVTVSVAANAVQDAATNHNAATSASVISNPNAVTLGITPNATSTNANPITFTVQFNTPVSGFTAGDITLTNGVAGTFTAVDADTYTLLVTPVSEGSVSVSVDANAAQDSKSNGNSPASASVIFDQTLPGLTITPDAVATNASPITFTFQFTEPVTSFTASDISLTNGTAGAFTAIDADTYRLQVTPVADGSLTVNVGANRAQDLATNGNSAATASVTSDRIPPALNITPDSGLTNASTITFTFQFTEAVTGFAVGDVTLTNGTAGTLTVVDSDTYTLLVTPTTNGVVSVNVPANAAIDAASNGNAAASASVTSDRTPPGLSISPNGGTTIVSPILFTFQFTEPVTGFDASDIVLTNGVTGPFTAVDSETYTLQVIPTANGSVGVSVAANAAQDAAANGNNAVSAAVNSQNASPVLSITPNATATNVSPIQFTFQFTEAVSGFSASDITLSNGTAGTFKVVDADTYTLLVVPVASGVVSVNVAANVAQNTAQNGNTAASAAVTFDQSSPGLTITPNATLTNAGSISFTFQFTEPATGFTASDILLSNGIAGTFTAVDADTYTLSVTPTANGVVGVNVSANAATDLAGNGNLPASASITSDRTAPGLTITPNNTATNASPITFTFQFTEPVSGFSAGDVSLTNGSAGTFTAIDGDTYTLQVTPTSSGPVSVAVAANAAQDAATNGNSAASATVNSDRIAPTATITAVSPAPRTTSVSSLTIVFSEAVTGFGLTDLTLTRDGGTNLLTGAQTLTTTDNVTFTLGNLTGLTSTVGSYVLKLNAPGSGIQDGVGNLLTADATGAWSRANPVVTLSINKNSIPEAAGTATVTATLSSATDVDVVINLKFAGTALFPADYSHSSTQILIPAGSTTGTMSVTAVSDGELEPTESITIDINSLTNASSNGSQQVSTQILDDDHAPVFTTSSSLNVPENSTAVLTVNATDADLPPQTVTYSISGGPDQSLFAITPNGVLTFRTAPDFESPADAGFDNVYNVQVVANDGHAGITLQNLAITVTDVDETPPTVSIGAISPNPRTTSVDSIQIVFSKAVSGFDLGDLSLARNGGANLLTAGLTLTTSDNITFTLQGLSALTTADGSYLLGLNATGSGIIDGASNSLTTGAAVSWQTDTTSPVATISAVSPDPRSTSVSSLTIVFSKAVNGFDLSDLSLSRDGSPNLLTGAQTLTTSDNITYTLGNLTGITGLAGSYALSLSALNSGVQDSLGNLLTVSTNKTWTRIEPTASLSVDHGTIAEASGAATVTATLSAVTDVDVTVVLGFSGTATFSSDYIRSGTQIVIPAGTTSGSVLLTAVQDGELESTESVIVSINSVTNGVTTGGEQATTQILDDDHAPVFTSNATPSIPENTTSVITVIATDADIPAQTVTYSITGGADQTLFSITPNGVLSFLSVPNFELPADSDANNHYEVQVTANDGHGGISAQNLTIAVTDVNEGPQLILNGSDATWIKKQPAATLLPQITVGGGVSLAGGTLTIAVNAVGTKKILDLFHIPSTTNLGSSSGPQFASGRLTLQVQLNQTVTTDEIQSVLRGITFATKGKGLKTLTRTMDITLSDASGHSSTVHQTVHVRKKP